MPGLYRDNDFKDNCGFGLITNRYGVKSHAVITKSISALKSMTHRGGIGADGKTGDGCGLLFNLDHEFYRNAIKLEQNIILPSHFAITQLFIQTPIKELLPRINTILKNENLQLEAVRLVPVDKKILGTIASACLPEIYQLFISGIDKSLDIDLFESSLLQARKFIEEIYNDDEMLYVCSMSSRTIVYKGLMLPNAIDLFYKDLQQKDFTASICVFHQRFSTNTSPKWHLAQPFRLLAHNGEINAIRGNRNWAKARQSILSTPLLPKLKKFKYLVNEKGSDSSSLDNMIEILVQGGINIFKTIRMVLPPAWQNGQILDAEVKAFHEYNSMHMEAWDGPAGIVMTDGSWAICVLDRNGLRPARYQIDEEGLITIASETGVNPTNEDLIINKGRVKPGGILAINTETGELHDEKSIDDILKLQNPYREWLRNNAIYIESSLNEFEGPGLKKIPQNDLSLASRLYLLFKEERSSIIKPLAVDSQEGTGSMGDDTALAVMSKMHRQIYDFFRQQFAQVTNPPIDSLREKSVMSLETCFGPELNIYEETPGHAKRLITTSPILSHKKLATIMGNKYFKSKEFTLNFNKSISLKKAIKNLRSDVVDAVRSGYTIIHLNENIPDKDHLPINALLGLGAVHQELVKLGLRTDANLIVSSASARDTHHIACLIGFGATAVFPWLAYQSILDLTEKNELKGDANENCARYRKGLNKGLLKIISKMGISTISSYRGSQLFEIVGLNHEVVNICFTNTASRIEGKNFKDLEQSLRSLDDYARSNLSDMNVGGLLKYIHGGEYHTYNPEIVKKLQEAVSAGSSDVYKEYSKLVDQRPPAMLRDLLAVDKTKKSVPLDKVEKQELILKRFDSAGMSLGALSPDAHETLAQAMNSIGGRSNSGEGGEAVERYGTDKMSKIKQVASGRFGVTPHYLVNAEVLQIKIAQGAKPGEGGQLPGGKVNKLIAKLRYSTPGVTLISPPPHHDIYSIEDLAQIIFDLKQVNPSALVSVKLVSEPGVGTIAAGVAKAYADLITISGHDGGTGASPLSSIRYAGSPWELGLSEAHQALRESGLRNKIRLQADGGMKTGLDVIKAAILGAESFGFGTGPMIAMGCKYLRICHLNNCATGVATQRKDIINHHFIGEKERVVNYFKFIADDVRQHLSEMGVLKLEDIIGQTNYLKVIEDLESQYKQVDLSAILYQNKSIKEPYFCRVEQNDPWDMGSLAKKILRDIKAAIKSNKTKSFNYHINNTDRSIGASISGHIAKVYGETGLNKPIQINFNGSAGQSFGCWNANGLHIVLNGDANDYVGKGMNGGKIVVKNTSDYAQSSETTLIGNTCLYGATGGEIYVAGLAGERFAVRNSGAYAVIEGAGDHCCEYMTGGQVTVLGSVGANFGAGMTGGFAYVLDEDRTFFDKCNRGLVNIDRIINEEMESHRKHLKETILKHFEETQSPRSKIIYDDFDKYEQLFWLVSPAALNVKDLLKATTANAA